MNARRASGASLTDGHTAFPGVMVGVISGMCRGKVHAYAGTCCTGEPRPGSSDGKGLWNPATPPRHPHARRTRQSAGPLPTFPAAWGWLPAPVPPYSGCAWLGSGCDCGGRPQPWPQAVAASPLTAVPLPCSELVPGSLPFILLAQALAWEAYQGPPSSLPYACCCSLRAGVLPL